MQKTLVFDMDGTIADFYSVHNWRYFLEHQSALPYAIAKPLVDMDTLNELLHILKENGWTIAITSWMARESTPEYDAIITSAKIEWLKRYNFKADEIHIVPYGTKKSDCTKDLGGYQILVDDNKEVRKSWTLGDTIDATKNILEEITNLILMEMGE